MRKRNWVGVCIVNYKTATLTINCLRSLAMEARLFDVIVVDNDSQDGSFSEISAAVTRAGWSDWVTVIESKLNGGFAYGNNIAIRAFLTRNEAPEYLYLLNPDTVVLAGAIDRLVSFMQGKRSAGIIGSQIEGEHGQLLNSAFKFHTCFSELNKGASLSVLTKLLKRWVTDEKIPTEPVKVDWVSGASMMIRREVFEQTGLLDEAYFMYFEETDFCMQAGRAGWDCWYVPSSRVMHLVGQSSGITNEKVLNRMPTYWFDSRRRYYLKNYNGIHACCADFFWLLGFSTWKLRCFIQRKEDNSPPYIFRDMLFNSVLFRGFKIGPAKND